MARAVPRLGIVGAALLVLLAACDPEEVANRIAEDAAERATGQDVEIDPETGEVTIEGENVGSTIPADFPIAAVPLPDASLVVANSSPDAGGVEWNVLYEVDGPEALAAYRARVEAAGYLIANEFSDTGIQSFQGKSFSYTISAAWLDGEDSDNLSINVGPPG
jgi:hypothetical protein